jgi:hypothetical protein
MPGWQAFTKSDSAESAPKAAKARKASVDQYGLARLAKSEAKTPQGMMRLGERIIEKPLPEPVDSQPEKAQGLTYQEQRCHSIDPNSYRTRLPFTRVRGPREAPKRLPTGSTDARFILPRVTLEGLRALTIELAHQQQNSDWPGERCRYPATKNYHLTAALNDYFKKLGFEQFCLEELRPTGRRVRRFVVAAT